MPRPVIFVGQAPSRNSDPERPFSGRSGYKLRALLGEERIDAANLLPAWPGKAGKGDAFDLTAARAAASRLEAEHAGSLLVLVGKQVARAHRVRAVYFEPVDRPCGTRLVTVPHPSGVNRWWNDPGNRERAAAFFRELSG